MSWTDERIALLKKLWGEGKTAAEIAKTLGDVTRNAVIGKAHRLKLASRISPIQQNKKPRAEKVAKLGAKKPREPRPVSAPRINIDDIKILNGTGVTLLELTESMCRWPVGDPKSKDFRYCGCSSVPGLPYCPDHARAAFQPQGKGRSVFVKEDSGEVADILKDDVLMKVANS
ncbi:MAG: gcrA cell cycle regulator family protein [Alphaproteobacteria bacterium]|nr:gcrA cell cycle regulator family protein [Alphaproteobacteria bacterium]